MSINPRKLGLGTLVTHFLEGDNPHNAHITPLYQTSTYSFPDVQTSADTFDGKVDGFIYSRSDNPNARQLAEKIAVLEGLDLLKEASQSDVKELVRGKAFSSGMAAISTAVLSLAKAGSTIVSQRVLYGNTYNLFKKIVPQYDINVVYVEGSDLDEWEAAFAKHPDAILAYLETPANPTMQVVDIEAVARIAHARDAWVMVDNTFATPYCQRPLTLGADVVAHSTTKYLAGHGLLIGGAIVTRHPEFLDPEKTSFILTSRVLGGAPSPFDAWLTHIGLKTFELRMQRHVENASQTASWLAGHPKVARVFYPGLADSPGHATARKQMVNGFGGMLSFELKGGYQAGVQLMNNLELITLAVSLGNLDSLIEHPASMTHAAFSPEDRLEAGVSNALVRFSVGIENIEDVIADLEQALNRVSQ
ncbi:MAG: trans-sulfuration enzyme family protein [Anaerolineales bacterium]